MCHRIAVRDIRRDGFQHDDDDDDCSAIHTGSSSSGRSCQRPECRVNRRWSPWWPRWLGGCAAFAQSPLLTTSCASFQFLLLFLLRRLRQRHAKAAEAAKKKELSPWDKANLLETRSHALPMVQVRPETEMPYFYRECFESGLQMMADDAIPLRLIDLLACAMMLLFVVVAR